MPPGKRVLLNQGRQKGILPERRYFAAIGLSREKTVADRLDTNMLLIITNSDHGLFSFVNINALERP